MISKDARLQTFGLLMVPAFVGHAIQLLGEDTPWAPHAWARYWIEPGWHLFLHPSIPSAIGVALAGAVVGLAIRRTRPWVLAIAALYWLHYLTYPYRIRNHMTHMLATLTMVGGVWLIGWAWERGGSEPRGPRPRLVDRHAVDGAALVLCITYFFAGFHKINDNFLSIGASSHAVNAMVDFWRYGDLGHMPPSWMQALAPWGTVVVECTVPIVAWRFARLRVPAILTLLAFHFPMISTMNVSDYPMITFMSYPLLFTRGHFRILSRHLFRLSRPNVAGAAIGVALQIWFIPWWGALTIFGLLVMALYGWSAGAMLEMVITRRRRASGRSSSAGRRAGRARS
jgi:hypothetical protein